MEDSKKIIIGWNEIVHLPDFRIFDLPAKIDTGAKTSSLDVEDVQFLPHNHVKFKVVLDGQKRHRTKTIIAKSHRRSQVRTSYLHTDDRIFIKAKIKIGKVLKRIEINLTNRRDLKYRMILGRTAIPKKYFINPRRSRLLAKIEGKQK